MGAHFIVISGIPGSGKSTLGRIIANAFNIPILDKDVILEYLFENLGVGNAEWRTKLSRLADEELRKQAGTQTSAVLTSWWRHPRSESTSGTSIEWLQALPGELVEVYCSCSPSVAATRFLARQRHVGHLDFQYTYAALLESFEQQARLGPLATGRIIQVNTEITPGIAEIEARIFGIPTEVACAKTAA